MKVQVRSHDVEVTAERVSRSVARAIDLEHER
jgi:hypothetical protein